MKSRSRIATTALVLSFAFQAAAFADTVEGRVARATSSNLAMVVYDPQGRPYPNQLNLRVDSETRYNGVVSASALRNGDPISADVHQEESGLWRADGVTLFRQMNARPATQNPPPTMRDVLGNPVVKGALVGAATGAIASSASGGKAGKGALVGAGVGAAAGLLGEMFSNRSQAPAQDDDNY